MDNNDENKGNVEGIDINNMSFDQLADAIGSRILEKFQTEGTTNEQTETSTQQSVKQDEKNTSDQQSVNAQSVASEVFKLIQQSQVNDSDKAMKALWSEKYSNTVSQVPGFDDYMKEEDEWGRVRENELMKIEDYDQRSKALQIQQKSYREALAGQSGRRPVVNNKARQKAVENESRYNEIDKKLGSGEYTNISDFTNDFMTALEQEMRDLS